jgi:hypothetical protein
MRLYIAGLFSSHFQKDGNLYRKCSPNAQLLRDDVKWYLESYHYVSHGRYMERMRQDKVRIFLDSGAFSAFSLGATIDIGAYAEFVREHQDVIEMASVLDAIGDPLGTWNNQKELERRGVEVLPCFHYGEPWDLCRYYAQHYPYITIGGMVPIPNKKLEGWLDELWGEVLTDKDGYAKVKVHGFGQTARNLIVKYPWYSVDSSSWVQAGANGMMILPEIERSIPVSARSPNTKVFDKHFDSYPVEEQKIILDLLAYYGLSLTEVRDDYPCRWALDAFSFHRLGVNLGEDHWRKPFRNPQPTLLGTT